MLPAHIQKLSDESGIKCDRLSDDLYRINDEVYMEYGAIACLSRAIYNRKYPLQKRIETIDAQSWNKWLDNWLAEARKVHPGLTKV